MAINPLTGLFANQSQSSSLQKTGTRIQTAIANLLSGNKIARAGDDVASLTTAAELQARLATYRQSATSIAQADSLLQVAEDGVDNVQNVLERLNTIATQSNSGALDANARSALDKEFQSLVATLDQIAGNTTFGGQKLLDGSLSGNDALSLQSIIKSEEADVQDAKLSLDAIDADALFDSKKLSVTSQANAAKAVEAIGNALKEVNGIRSGIGSFRQRLDYSQASVASAIFNQDAARSVLSDADFTDAATLLSLGNLQQDVQIALAAQSKRLPPSMLELIGS